jgi:hypothetical protein
MTFTPKPMEAAPRRNWLHVEGLVWRLVTAEVVLCIHHVDIKARRIGRIQRFGRRSGIWTTTAVKTRGAADDKHKDNCSHGWYHSRVSF